MQHLDNDMDEIFHKAGHEYPLNTSSSNWEAVKTALYDEGALPPAKKTNYRKFLWLLLLLIPFAWMKFSQNTTKSSITENHSGNVVKEQSNAIVVQPNALTPSLNNTDKKTLAGQSIKTQNNKTIKSPSANNSSASVSSETKPAASSTQQTISPNQQAVARSGEKSINKPAAVEINKTISSQKSSIKKNNNLSAPSATNTGTSNGLSIKALKSSSLLNATNGKIKNANNNIINNSVATDDELKYSNLNNRLAPLFDAYSLNKIKKLVPTTNPNSENAVSTSDKKKATTKKLSKLYVGLIVGPDLSYIKAQKVKNIGYSVGLNFGYRLNKHFAFEAGAMYDQKKYFTKGEYFDKLGAGVPQNVRLAWLNGGCNMFEFPLLARYNFNISKSSFFVSSGFTSYVMSKESYQYSAEANGSWYEGHKSYKGSGSHLFSNMQWSLGYNQKLSSSTQIRIEPYIKIPVKNIGIGKMPITSSGIYLGITHDLK